MESTVTPTAATQGLELRPMAAMAETGELNCDPKSKSVAHESEVKVGKENIDLNQIIWSAGKKHRVEENSTIDAHDQLWLSLNFVEGDLQF